ncbi:MAG: BrnT family toxin [bacterium]
MVGDQMSQYGWYRFEWDDEDQKNGNVQHLRDHNIEPEEAEECFFHNYQFCRDERRFTDIYILDGRTDRGRRLRLVFQDKGNGLARVFTGWDLKQKKR